VVAEERESTAEGDGPAAGEAIPTELETAAGSNEAAEGGVVAVEGEAAEQVDETAVSESVPTETETASASESGEAVEGAVVALERNLAVQVDEPTVSQAIPTEMETAAGSDEAIENGVVTAEEEPAAQADEPETRLDRPSSEQPASASEVSDDLAANLQSATTAKAAQEVTVPLTAKVDPPELRDQPQGRPEPQPAEPEVLALDETPKPSQMAQATQPQPDLDRLIARGDQLLALGDVASARLFYRMAATKGSARGATAMGSTYDPVYMEQTGVVGPRPSPAEAIKWYRQAIDMGHRGAEVQLRELKNRLERAAALGDGEAQRILEGVRN
jgi:hypothetical protein